VNLFPYSETTSESVYLVIVSSFPYSETTYYEYVFIMRRLVSAPSLGHRKAVVIYESMYI